MLPEPEPDTFEKRLRFGCGFLAGIVLGLSLGVQFSFGRSLFLGAVAAAAILCGLLAVRYGDQFWRALIRTFWW